MAQLDFYELKQLYRSFHDPFVDVLVNGKHINANKKTAVSISDVDIEITSDFEASIASFVIYGTYDNVHHMFNHEIIKDYIAIGSALQLNIGYGASVREVFRGFISKVRFLFGKDEVPGIEVTAMDVKGIMMANNNSLQLKGDTYKKAIEEIFAKQCYTGMVSSQIIKEVTVDPTPDASPQGGGQGGAPASGSGEGGQSEATDKSIEMVAESDYEFVVKVAKKFNFEFYSVGGNVYFREAKKIKDPLLSIDPGAIYNGLNSYSVEYDITGLVENIEVRGVDVGKNKMINSSAKKLNNKLSFGSKANALIKGQKKVYIDPTIHSKEEADSRAAYLANEIAYRFGTLEAEFRGLPELTPGYFIEFQNFGKGVDNKYYITHVRHVMDSGGSYTTTIKAAAASIDGSAESSSGV